MTTLVQLIERLSEVADDPCEHSGWVSLCGDARDLLVSYHRLALDAGFDEVGGALKAIPIKDAALVEAKFLLQSHGQSEAAAKCRAALAKARGETA